MTPATIRKSCDNNSENSDTTENKRDNYVNTYNEKLKTLNFPFKTLTINIKRKYLAQSVDHICNDF